MENLIPDRAENALQNVLRGINNLHQEQKLRVDERQGSWIAPVSYDEASGSIKSCRERTLCTASPLRDARKKGKITKHRMHDTGMTSSIQSRWTSVEIRSVQNQSRFGRTAEGIYREV
jgi:hypothetical protein